MIQTSDLPRRYDADDWATAEGSAHDHTYHDMLRHIVEEGDFHADRTNVGTKSVFGYQCRFDLSKGFPLLTTKKMFMRGIVEELRWFLLGRTDEQWLAERRVKIWSDWATEEQCAKFGRKAGDLGPIYGFCWRHFGAQYQGPIGSPYLSTTPEGGERASGSISYGGIDQIKNLCNDLLKNPGSRRLIVSAWDPEVATKVALPPCHTMFQCKVRTVFRDNTLPYPEVNGGVDQYLDLQLYQRSADSFLGVPFNIASYALLTHLLAAVSGMRPGRFIHTFGDLHIYTNHKDQVIEQLGRTPRPAPTLKVHGIGNRFLGSGFDGLMEWAQGKDMEGITLEGYDPYPAIAAPVAV